MVITAAIPHAAAAALTTAAAAAATTAAAALAAAAVPFSRTSSPLTALSIANVLSVAPGALALRPCPLCAKACGETSMICTHSHSSEVG